MSDCGPRSLFGLASLADEDECQVQDEVRRRAARRGPSTPSLGTASPPRTRRLEVAPVGSSGGSPRLLHAGTFMAYDVGTLAVSGFGTGQPICDERV